PRMPATASRIPPRGAAPQRNCERLPKIRGRYSERRKAASPGPSLYSCPLVLQPFSSSLLPILSFRENTESTRAYATMLMIVNYRERDGVGEIHTLSVADRPRTTVRTAVRMASVLS